MNPDQTKQFLILELGAWCSRHGYMFAIGEVIPDGGKVYQSTYFPQVTVNPTGSQMGESFCELEDQTLEELIEHLDDEISFGDWVFDSGEHYIMHWPDYYNSESEARDAVADAKINNPVVREMIRLTELRTIKEMVQ